MDIFCWLYYYITLFHYKIDKNKEEKWFSFYEKLKIIFSINLTRPGSGIRIRIEILGWIRIRIKGMRIRNTAKNRSAVAQYGKTFVYTKFLREAL